MPHENDPFTDMCVPPCEHDMLQDLRGCLRSWALLRARSWSRAERKAELRSLYCGARRYRLDTLYIAALTMTQWAKSTRHRTVRFRQGSETRPIHTISTLERRMLAGGRLTASCHTMDTWTSSSCLQAHPCPEIANARASTYSVTDLSEASDDDKRVASHCATCDVRDATQRIRSSSPKFGPMFMHAAKNPHGDHATCWDHSVVFQVGRPVRTMVERKIFDPLVNQYITAGRRTSI
jgi:hypothetical protein